MAGETIRQDRDLVLSPTQYAYVQDRTSGNVRVWTGPRGDTLTQNDRLVVWTGRKFLEQPDVNQARQTFVTATENQYVVLTDPAADDPEKFPEEGSTQLATALAVGRRIVITGPASFALWPGQTADPIDGHRLTHNQYLLTQVYEPEAAKKFAARAIAAPQAGDAEKGAQRAVKPREFTMGERVVIKGTDVSFYVPPTGIEVVPEVIDGKRGGYVREAATLERLEYCVLTREDGEKRYERGPQVVFPEPTERFVTERGERKFRAIELNPQSALYIKVIADYANDTGRTLRAWRGDGEIEVTPGQQLKEGDELFITGANQPIYFPRPEESVIHYGNQRKHHAIAIPAGEGRYALHRVRGEVDTIKGPRMFLPDPRTQVIVRRVLDPRTVRLWYPNSQKAPQVNAQLAQEQAEQGEQYLNVSQASLGESGSLARSYSAVAQATPTSSAFAGEQMKRRTEYTAPRTITLDTEYLGPPRISVWPGYAVLVMDPTGNRRVEIGPTDILMKYHESLMALTLSTGRPKGTGQPFQTVYLRTINNAVGDRVTVETRDLVPIMIELSLRVNFEAQDDQDAERWFNVEDYIALLTDAVRSRLRNLAKQHEVQKFYTEAINLIRDALLGESKDRKREGLAFEENGMRLYDVEVLGVTIAEPGVKQLLDGAMNSALQGAIQLSLAEQDADRDARLEELKRERLEEHEKTREAESAAAIHEIERDLTRSLRAIAAALSEAQQEAEIAALSRAENKATVDQEIALLAERNGAVIAHARAEVELFVKRANAIDPKLAEAIRVYGQERVASEIAQALGPYSLAVGTSAVDVLRQRLDGTALSPVLDALAASPFAQLAGNGSGEERNPAA